MKVLTVKNPWAYAFFISPSWQPFPLKDIENRSRKTKHRGELFIHVSQQRDPIGDQFIKEKFGVNFAPNLPTGLIIGSVELVGITRLANSPWAMPGYYHWIVKNPQLLKQPIPTKGKLGIWNYEQHQHWD